MKKNFFKIKRKSFNKLKKESFNKYISIILGVIVLIVIIPIWGWLLAIAIIMIFFGWKIMNR